MWKEIAKFGKKLVEGGYLSSNFGNISVRAGDSITITRSGSMLDEITEDSVVTVDLYKHSSLDLIASSETIVHREIYKKTPALAIIHAHCPFAVVESLLNDTSIKPYDSEGKLFFNEIPIVTGGMGTKELAENTARVLENYKGCIVKAHGTFATGKILKEAYVHTTVIEHSAKIKYYYDLNKNK
ncbi:MAG: L-fuculose phosphate aldolase [Candidatus Methanofastidiosum methylothiophilum]|jgi:L-fuculose-phosphate aldolase|uniref:L-fuculose phosphate aldolase n=1 Tax=Candidatus Methanofastidiosum methylothiophilum TaxID=1705564 RepID=A0A150JD60_9EURY|nr:MAG: L-fuculose phosphate aldolase [Candidatus Methanofastidiosum methylthiophilus]MBP7819788.1 aldolase [Methanofastidiosum sp.]OQC51030.1 MAG: L-fuculose phosphate aldolase [Euryarchaeota archaeon ADurb.Bin023]KYC56947.1 MAG: L-fuculose phosphate aldolase [Candidatus Methanofastidiosum methylthiophilus]KYC58029.1 MAG: L-fuculose phosphate aldolase [Candidatus Methanofastidiosum methylthiophilus]